MIIWLLFFSLFIEEAFQSLHAKASILVILKSNLQVQDTKKIKTVILMCIIVWRREGKEGCWLGS